MAFCPKCRSEYRAELDFCSDCSADLVEVLPPEIPEEFDDTDWVEVHVFPGSLYAKMAVELLIQEEISAYTVSQFGGAGLGVSGADYVGSGAVVMVLERNFEEAIKILEPMIEELPGNSEDDYQENYDD